MSIEYLDLADFIAISAAVTGLDEDTITKVADLGLADSALHAPSAQFGDHEFYEDFVDKQVSSLSASRATIACPMATSARPGWRSGCSSISTAGPGLDDPSLTKPKGLSWRSRPASWTKNEQLHGSATMSSRPNLSNAELLIVGSSGTVIPALASDRHNPRIAPELTGELVLVRRMPRRR